jgi:hypothetical protein
MFFFLLIQSLGQIIQPLGQPTSSVSSGASVGSGTMFMLVVGCAVFSSFALIYLILSGRKSEQFLRAELERHLSYLKELIKQTRERIARLDGIVVGQMRGLSPRASLSFNIAKQFLAVLDRRVVRLEQHLASGGLEELTRGYELIQQAVDNVGTGLDSVIFSETVLTLKPEQFEFGIDTMLEVVESDLNNPTKQTKSNKPVEMHRRQRNYTIRGFLRSLSGTEDKY